jgi:hypothetical protein
MPLLLFFGLAASAAEVGVFATLGGDASTGLRTGLDGLGPHTELAVELGGPKNAAHLGQRTYVTKVKDAWFCIPGVNLGWAHSFGDDATLGGYSLVAVGGYRSEVLPVMPMPRPERRRAVDAGPAHDARRASRLRAPPLLRRRRP